MMSEASILFCFIAAVGVMVGLVKWFMSGASMESWYSDYAPVLWPLVIGCVVGMIAGCVAGILFTVVIMAGSIGFSKNKRQQKQAEMEQKTQEEQQESDREVSQETCVVASPELETTELEKSTTKMEIKEAESVQKEQEVEQQKSDREVSQETCVVAGSGQETTELEESTTKMEIKEAESVQKEQEVEQQKSDREVSQKSCAVTDPVQKTAKLKESKRKVRMKKEDKVMARSNMFVNLENEFKFCSTEEITEKTLQEFGNLIGALGNINIEGKMMFYFLIAGARLGTAGDSGKLNAREKALVDATFGPGWSGDMKDIYQLIENDTNEEDYKLAKFISENLGNDVSISFLRVVLGFAYIDKKVNDTVMKKLDEMFGMHLLVLFMQSGLEEVPTSRKKPGGLEADIVEWFRSDDQMRTLDDIVAHFPGKSKTEVKKALDSLCDQGVLYGGDNMVGCMYGLV